MNGHFKAGKSYIINVVNTNNLQKEINKMSVEAKTRLLNTMKIKLSSILTVSNMEQFINVLSDEISHYDVTMIDATSVETDDMLDAYLDALRVGGRSHKTIARYHYIITRMLQAIHLTSREVTVYDVRRYLGTEKARGISDETLEGYRQVYSAYFNWLQREGLITTNPVRNVGVIKTQKKIKTIYTEIDIEKLKMNCNTLRDKAIVCLLLSTGCRISEVTELNRDAVDLSSLECKVLGKGNKERIVYLDPVAGMTLRNYLSTREDTNPALFLGKHKDRLQPGGVRCMLKKLEKKTYVNHVHPHKFRRTLATNLIRRGMPIEEVAAILGHDKLDTTMEYVVLDKTEVKHDYRKYAP